MVSVWLDQAVSKQLHMITVAKRWLAGSDSCQRAQFLAVIVPAVHASGLR